MEAPNYTSSELTVRVWVGHWQSAAVGDQKARTALVRHAASFGYSIHEYALIKKECLQIDGVYGMIQWEITVSASLYVRVTCSKCDRTLFNCICDHLSGQLDESDKEESIELKGEDHDINCDCIDCF